MQLHHFVNGRKPVALDPQAALPADGFVWADFVRDQSPDWSRWVEDCAGAAIDSQHVEDSFNPRHPSFFDGTAAYDMVVFEELARSVQLFPIEARVAALFVFDRLVVTVRPADGGSITQVSDYLRDGRVKGPPSPLRLALLLIDTMVDSYLAIREPLHQRLTGLQDALLDPNNLSQDWRELLVGRRETRRLEALSERQVEALDAWHRNSRFDWDQADEVRYHDVAGHVGRVLTHARDMERDLEAAVQLHFASVAHRTNRVMQVLTVLSAIFFPLTFIVGVYGMNFENMPELRWRYGYFAVLGVLALIAGGLTLYFRRKRLF